MFTTLVRLTLSVWPVFETLRDEMLEIDRSTIFCPPRPRASDLIAAGLGRSMRVGWIGSR